MRYALLFLALILAPFAALAQEAAVSPWAGIVDQVVGLVATALGLAITALVGIAARWVHKKTRSDFVRDLVLRIDDAAQRVVSSVEQEIRPTLKGALSDGKLDEKERDKLKAAAMKGLLAAVSLKELIKVFGSADEAQTHLAHAIENAVRRDKAANGPLHAAELDPSPAPSAP